MNGSSSSRFLEKIFQGDHSRFYLELEVYGHGAENQGIFVETPHSIAYRKEFLDSFVENWKEHISSKINLMDMLPPEATEYLQTAYNVVSNIESLIFEQKCENACGFVIPKRSTKFLEVTPGSNLGELSRHYSIGEESFYIILRGALRHVPNVKGFSSIKTAAGCVDFVFDDMQHEKSRNNQNTEK